VLPKHANSRSPDQIFLLHFYENQLPNIIRFSTPSIVSSSSLKNHSTDPKIICNLVETAPKLRPQLHSCFLWYPALLHNLLASPNHCTFHSRDILDIVFLIDDHELKYSTIDPSSATKNIPIIAFMAEHQPSSCAMYFMDCGYLIIDTISSNSSQPEMDCPIRYLRGAETIWEEA
jgi:hypothetical protein